MATINSSIQADKAKVVIYNGTTLVETCTCSDSLQSFTIDRDEENNKIFGFGICQSIKMELIDLERKLDVAKGYWISVSISSPNVEDGAWTTPFPRFYIEDITRDEETNSISVVAYDRLYKASMYNVSELTLEPPYFIFDVAVECAMLLGLNRARTLSISQVTGVFTTQYDTGANFSGNETIREVLDAIAEATQTIYYVDETEALVFRKLLKTGGYTISKDNYFTLKSGSPITIGAICHVTELGDNVISGDENGIIQYVRENPFWNNRDDIGEIVDAAMAAVEGLTIQEFICDDWSYTRLLTIGTRIGFEAEDGSYIYSYLLNDTITFDGTLSELSQWKFEPNDNETPNNPSSLGEQLSQTTARVDKVAKEIELKVQEIDGHDDRLSSLEVNSKDITTRVSSVESKAEVDKNEINDKYETLKKEVEQKISADEVVTTIKTELKNNGVSKVTTTTGTFDSTGLTITQSNAKTSTNVNSNGLAIYLDEIRKEIDEETGIEKITNEPVLTATMDGVKAKNLHATTYLYIGNTSRFEDWNGRTGCFWIGEYGG